ncbi:hypothetical protein FNYG_15635 [Fusarium nygamai]|uniref:Uncharacterized protein n=1 Tax=Gibberella nygamai TaxID=42673 RepID=A0A2K0U9H3_GIBNY|nr:hypothetical protein FNYG_15635 [Fusarium nygamai]
MELGTLGVGNPTIAAGREIDQYCVSGPQIPNTGNGGEDNNGPGQQQFIGSSFHGVDPFLRQ